ncbi:hypothetical protein M8A51_00250 [Schlegelella sp. S2-27]|uniref:Uncharacterized protein n=1 Tax=Caldimonas mangrovi TaxID=2944811 RepID=A0ABT0YHU4_9BURK|nr:hypothetical protein [Caldimonas mangrovi]
MAMRHAMQTAAFLAAKPTSWRAFRLYKREFDAVLTPRLSPSGDSFSAGK